MRTCPRMRCQARATSACSSAGQPRCCRIPFFHSIERGIVGHSVSRDERASRLPDVDERVPDHEHVRAPLPTHHGVGEAGLLRARDEGGRRARRRGAPGSGGTRRAPPPGCRHPPGTRRRRPRRGGGRRPDLLDELGVVPPLHHDPRGQRHAGALLLDRERSGRGAEATTVGRVAHGGPSPVPPGRGGRTTCRTGGCTTAADRPTGACGRPSVMSSPSSWNCPVKGNARVRPFQSSRETLPASSPTTAPPKRNPGPRAPCRARAAPAAPSAHPASASHREHVVAVPVVVHPGSVVSTGPATARIPGASRHAPRPHRSEGHTCAQPSSTPPRHPRRGA